VIATLVAVLLGATPIQRWAVVIGANDGGAGRESLRWAVRDAERVAAVLTEIGGVLPERSLLLKDPPKADVERALATVTGSILQAQAADPSVRTELVLYYSGHADPAGLLLGSQRFEYATLRRQLDLVPADVRVVVLDACASGALLRAKGGTPVDAFVDVGGAAKGHAYVTSAAADEVAQESDRLEASFFTHHLVAGLRGAADTNHDGHVTLVEAYEHASRETLAGTAETISGPQHPSYDIQLAGRGDLVLTELANGPRLVLDGTIEGRVFVRDASGELVGETDKIAGVDIALALPPGPYRVAVVLGREVYAADVALAADARVGRASLADAGPALSTRERGGTLWVDALPRPERSRAVRVALLPLFGFDGWGDDVAVNGLDLALFADKVASVRGVQLAPLYAETHDLVGIQLGVVAVADSVRGAQLGLVTVADKVDGIALALVPWVGDGLHSLDLAVDSRARVDLFYRLGTRYLHVVGGVGWDPSEHGATPAIDFGFGTRVPIWRLTIDLDLTLRIPLVERDELEVVARSIVGIPIIGGLGVFVGSGLAGRSWGDGDVFVLAGIRFAR